MATQELIFLINLNGEYIMIEDFAPVENPLPRRWDVIRGASHSEMHTAQIQALYQQIPMVLSVETINATLVAAALSSQIQPSHWLIFFALVLLLVGIRASGWCLFRMRKSSNSPSIWAAWATIGSGLSGILWGVGSVLLLPTGIVAQAFLAFVIGIMCAAPLVSFSYYLPAFVIYVIPATLPLACRFLLAGGPVNPVMGDMILVFAAAMTLAAYNSSRVYVNLLKLNGDLTARTTELSAINALLEAEVTQRKMAESQLRQAQKMEAIGQLTGGIAHDFNNLLTGVIGYLDMACRRVVEDHRTSGLLRAALHAAQRGATLTRQLLAFSSKQHLDPRPVDVTSIIDSVEDILRQTIGPDIRLATRAEPNLALAWADPNQLELAILNLALNARDAMPNGGTLRIVAHQRGAQTVSSPIKLPSGDYVMVSVTDTGTGMDDETLARAFDPFFTTKEAGRGSGLGLSMVHGFAAQSGGSVQITSTLAKGTRVDLWLPSAEGGTDGSDHEEPDMAISESSRARILVCDDDDDVRGFVVEVLREDGFTVWEADRPTCALEILERERPIDLLLVDYAMPEMTGWVVIDRARATQPGLKALLMTGYAEILRAGGVGGVPLLAKPFKVADLERQIGEILSERRPDLKPHQPTEEAKKFYEVGFFAS